MRNIMKEAHKMAKEITTKYNDVDYKVQLGLCISYLASKEEEVEMVELKGSEKQIAWAKDIKADMLKGFEIIEKIEEAFKGQTNPNFITVLDAFKTAKEAVKNNDSAKWFIEHRHYIAKPSCGLNTKYELDFDQLLKFEDKRFFLLAEKVVERVGFVEA